MANPQLEEGYTSIANEILDHLFLSEFSQNQWQIIIYLIRKTYGYRKKVDYIANCQIVNDVHLCKSVVSRCLSILEVRKVIIREGKNIGINKDWEQWGGLAEQLPKVSRTANNNDVEKLANLQPKLANLQPKLAEQLPKVSSPRGAQKKETITKETIQKQQDILILPDWLKKEVLDGFIEMRKRIKKPLTDYGVKLIIGELSKFKDNGEDPNEILNKSTMNSWQGVFSLKGKNNGGENGTNRGNYGGAKLIERHSYTEAPYDPGLEADIAESERNSDPVERKP